MTQQIVSKILKNMSRKLNENIVLKTFGRSLKVCLGKHNLENCVISEPDIYSIKLNSHLSDRQLLRVLRGIRLKWGRKSIVKDIKTKLARRKTIFEDFFSAEKVSFIHNGSGLERSLIFCNDIQQFVERVCDFRGYHFTEIQNQIGSDSGKGKICFSLVSMYTIVSL